MGVVEPLPVRYRSETGGALISVTQVLTLAQRIDLTWFTEASRIRGQLVHALTEVFDRGERVDVPDHVLGYMEAYQYFLAVCRPEYAGSELAVRNALYGLGGRIDRVIARMWGGDLPALLDFKTGPFHAWHGQQLAAYNMLRPTGARFACYLQANGRYKLRQFEEARDHRLFMADLAKVRGTVTERGDYWIAA